MTLYSSASRRTLCCTRKFSLTKQWNARKWVSRFYASLGVKTERVMTDNGSCYRSRAFGRACKRFALKHIFTKPYTPKTNGKAERFIQTSLRERAYARAYNTSIERTAERPRCLRLAGNNLLRLHS